MLRSQKSGEEEHKGTSPADQRERSLASRGSLSWKSDDSSHSGSDKMGAKLRSISPTDFVMELSPQSILRKRYKSQSKLDPQTCALPRCRYTLDPLSHEQMRQHPLYPPLAPALEV
jgi:hypothetical protein